MVSSSLTGSSSCNSTASDYIVASYLRLHLGDLAQHPLPVQDLRLVAVAVAILHRRDLSNRRAVRHDGVGPGELTLGILVA